MSLERFKGKLVQMLVNGRHHFGNVAEYISADSDERGEEALVFYDQYEDGRPFKCYASEIEKIEDTASIIFYACDPAKAGDCNKRYCFFNENAEYRACKNTTHETEAKLDENGKPIIEDTLKAAIERYRESEL